MWWVVEDLRRAWGEAEEETGTSGLRNIRAEEHQG
jgi:hypothetical protein